MFKGDEVAGEHFTSLYLNAIFEQVHFNKLAKNYNEGIKFGNVHDFYTSIIILRI